MELCLIICIILDLILSHLNDRGLGVPFEFWKIPVPNWMLCYFELFSLVFLKGKKTLPFTPSQTLYLTCMHTWYLIQSHNWKFHPEAKIDRHISLLHKTIWSFWILNMLTTSCHEKFSNFSVSFEFNYAFLTSTHSLQSRNILPNISPIWILHYQVDARQKS